LGGRWPWPAGNGVAAGRRRGSPGALAATHCRPAAARLGGPAALWRVPGGARKGEERSGGAGWSRELVWLPRGNGDGGAQSRGAAAGQGVGLAACFELKTTHARHRRSLSSRSTHDGGDQLARPACARGPHGAARAGTWPSGPMDRPHLRAPGHGARV
jgi:hypothetical protein